MKARICEIQFYFNIVGGFWSSWRAVEIPPCCVINFVSKSSCGHCGVSCLFLHHSFQLHLCAGNDFWNGYAAGRPVQHQDNAQVLHARIALLFGIFDVICSLFSGKSSKWQWLSGRYRLKLLRWWFSLSDYFKHLHWIHWSQICCDEFCEQSCHSFLVCSISAFYSWFDQPTGLLL